MSDEKVDESENDRQCKWENVLSFRVRYNMYENDKGDNDKADCMYV